ncbi:ABC transporter ATP-binding protein [Xanthobacter sp. TB0139]|uniref:ABC transporter ATP-binding protein n=1 Tax=Xanthobacter sp. TB0139 TaxID=3459178 RepID=UPI004039933F
MLQTTPPAVAPLLSLSGLTKCFGDVRAVDGVHLSLAQGEIHALIGPSGCGKSTLLRLVSGFERADAGRIEMAHEAIGHLPPERRDIGIVFQDYALFPHLTVAGNIGFGLNHLPRATREARVDEHMAMLHLQGLEQRYPAELSGGQQQRVALARSLAARPAMLLLDEPFSNLDASLREAARRDMRLLLKTHGISVLFVTHDREEALSFADRVSVLRAGRLEQAGPPEELYARPANAFVASFLGQTNLLSGKVPGAAPGRQALTFLGPLELDRDEPPGPVTLSLRPEALHLAPLAQDAPRFRVRERIFRGFATTYVLTTAEGQELQALAPSHASALEGEEVGLIQMAPAVVVERP